MIMKVLSVFAIFIRAVIRHLNNTSMRAKLFTAFFVVTALPFSVYIILNYISTTKSVEAQISYSLRSSVEQADSLLEYRAKNVVHASDLMLMDELLQEVMIKISSGDYSLTDQIRDSIKLTERIQYYEKSQEVYNIRLYIPSWLMFSDENKYFYNMENGRKTKWYAELEKQGGGLMWCPSSYLEQNSDEETVVSVARLIKRPDDYSKNVGMFRADIKESAIHEIIKDLKVTPSECSAVLNSKGEVISCTDGFANIYNEKSLNFLNQAAKTRMSTPQKILINGKQYLMIGTELAYTDWIVATAVPYGDITSLTSQTRNEMFVFIALMLICSYLLSQLLSNTITKRIFQLMKQMNRVKQGDLNIRVLQHGQDEVGQLSSSFNYMVLRMSQMLEEQNRLGKEIKSAELKALQAQINPHFLYNTLELIHWQAMKHDAPFVSAIVQTMARFYKLSLSKGEDVVSIQNEMELVKTYLQIQNMRFGDTIKFEIRGIEQIGDYSIPKIVLQPIVENSIMHGIRTKKEGKGNITISGSLDKGEIIITVIDDGNGMNAERLEQVRSWRYESTGNGYGLKNINERLKLHFGEDYGLTLESELGKGANVIVRLPASINRK